MENNIAPKEQEKAIWNEDLGIWQDLEGKAVVKIDESLNDGEPLYIFGYGSLIWRPGDLLETFDSYEVDCISHTRLFGQYSHDIQDTVNS